MIPYQLSFTGVRDYEPVIVQFFNQNDDIYITGPNGAGKSTITYCMGAVLASGKVDIGGLRSLNLPEQKIWHAQIHFLFHNVGPSQIDAYEYVQFSMTIEQQPSSPIKKEYYIYEGTEPNKWSKEQKFTSGSSDYNFREYKHQLLTKYKVDPDAFYLIWYQKEVNQFAAMDPKERFRIFSEMNKIDHIQKRLEEIKESLKEAEKNLAEAELQQKHRRHERNIRKDNLSRYEQRNKKLYSGLQRYVTALQYLCTYYQGKVGSLTTTIDLIASDIDEQKEGEINANRSLNLYQKQLADKKTDLGLVQHNLKTIKEDLQQKQDTKKKLEMNKGALEEKIKELQKEMRILRYNREETFNLQKKMNDKLTNLQEHLVNAEDELDQLEDEGRELFKELTRYTEKIMLYEKEKERCEELVGTHGFSHHIQSSIDNNQQKLTNNQLSAEKIKNQIDILEQEIKQLKANQNFSDRQREAIVHFQQQGIEIYALSQLVELKEEANPKIEQILDSIKYTLFLNTYKFEPYNDLYHVSLPAIIPFAYMENLTDIPIRTKQNLDEHMHPFAVKVLYWISQFLTEKEPYIKSNYLYDQRGIRGKQEKTQYILSKIAVERRREEKIKQLEQKKSELTFLREEIDRLVNEIQQLSYKLGEVKKAEGFLASESEYELLQRKVEHYEILDKQTGIKIEKQKTLKRKIEEEIRILQPKKDRIDDEVRVYQKYEQESAKIKQIQTYIKEIEVVNNHLKTINEKKEQYLSQESKIEDSIDEINREIRNISQDVNDYQEKLNKLGKELERNENELKMNENEYVIKKREFDKYIQEFNGEIDMTGIADESDAKRLRMEGMGDYEYAKGMKDIDEAAPENYKVSEEIYRKSKNEVETAKILVADYKEKEVQIFDYLQNLINMKVLEINQKFNMYMSQFGFDSQIDWDMDEDKHEQLKYYLYIKARKEGHRGKLEDVSRKARGNKVGKGVSGGEESLSSLLFALALLQTIEIHPGYIVLDEFDSALDEHRKDKVFTLYKEALKRKLIILSPKSHEKTYLDKFAAAYVVYHEPDIPRSSVFKLRKN